METIEITMPRKCIIPGCRSGYSPTKVQVAEEPPVSVHSFPVKNEEVFKKWRAVLSFMDMSHIKNFSTTGVCQLHFLESDYKGGKTVKEGDVRKLRVLKRESVPSVFPCIPKNLLKTLPKPRKTERAAPSLRQDKLKADADQMQKDMLKKLKVNSLSDLTAKLSEYSIPSVFTQSCHVLKTEADSYEVLCFQQNSFRENGPFVERSLVIEESLKFKAYFDGTLVNNKHFNDVCFTIRNKKDPAITQVDEVCNILALLLTIKLKPAEKLKSMLQNVNTDDMTEKERNLLSLIKEQLRLVNQEHPCSRKYSREFMMNCVIWARMSPKLYKELSNTSGLILPSCRQIRRFTSFSKFRGGVDSISFKYFEMRSSKLQAKDRIVHMAIDEVYTTQSLEMSGGNFFGETDGQLTRTLLCVHVNSVAGSYQDMVAMEPIVNISSEKINELFEKCLNMLKDVGFTVRTLTTDNHRVNQNFIFEKVNKYSDIFAWFDQVHVAKNMYYNFINKKTLTVPYLPTLKGEMIERTLKPDVSHLWTLFNMDQNLSRVGHKLSHKVLSPSNLERQNVGLMIAATDPSTVAALRYVARQEKDKYMAWEDTALFLEFINDWFTILNVSSSSAQKRFNDTRKAVMRLETVELERNITFLKNTGQLMNDWSDKKFKLNSKFSTDTMKAVQWTSITMTKVIPDLLTMSKDHNLGIDYICTGKLNSDHEEGAFGRRRQLSGTNYWTQVRQFFEAESLIRTHSLIRHSGYSHKDIQLEMKPAINELNEMDNALCDDILQDLDITCDVPAVEQMELTEAGGIVNISGYLAHQAHKKLKCRRCLGVLVSDQEVALCEIDNDVRDTLPECYDYIRLQDRGGLMYPSDFAVKLTILGLEVFGAIVNDPSLRTKFFSSHSTENVFCKVFRDVTEQNNSFLQCECSEGHKLVDSVLPITTRILFHVFSKNVVSKAMSVQHGYSNKRSSNDDCNSCTRTKSSYKRQKLQSAKKD